MLPVTPGNELKHADITGKIIFCAFEVHKFLGCGFQEIVYQRSLAMEFENVGIEFCRELEQLIFYKFNREVGSSRADFIVEGRVLVEVKAVSELNDVHLAQILSYLKAYRLEVGLLINFGEKSVRIKRVIRDASNQ